MAEVSSKVSVIIQGEDSDDNVIDRRMDCDGVIAFGVMEHGIEVISFGAINAIKAATIAEAMDKMKEELFKDFPMARVLSVLGDPKVIDLMEDED